MAIRKVGGELGQPLLCAMNVIATYQSAVSVGDHVVVSTSNNWSVNSAATGTDIRTVGVVDAVAGDTKTAVVKWYGYNKAFECANSAACSLGGFVQAETSGKVKTSTNATKVADAICVATAYPATGYICWLEN
jgi:hypothetical protein